VPFGYAGQVYTYESDSITELYQFAIHDKGGVIGLADNSKKPAALTGGESSDFPKSCPQWYAIDGTSVTCVTSDGDKYEFEYIPPQE
jgi:hypothetical protein